MKLLGTAFFAFLILAACSKKEVQELPAVMSQPNTEQTGTKKGSDNSFKAAYANFPENFESGTKTSYASGSVSLATGTWLMDEALLGTSTSDPKVGTKSVRIRNTGKLSMSFNVVNGISTVSVLHAAYGTDPSSTWELWLSSNNGSSYTKVGSTITSSGSTLQTANFTINQTGLLRLEIRKISGGSNRINVDNITINDQSTGGGGTFPADVDNMGLGNPSGATTSISNENNYLMTKVQYALSYNRGRATANWVSWYVGPTSLGSAARQDDFRADATLPAGWYRVGSTSYSGSGFDRGHNCPSADRTSSITNNSATFLMSNMIPQAPTNNQQTWANLEDYTRTLIAQGNECYVIMGCYGTGGSGSNGSVNTIDAGRITVPNRIWKVVVVIPQGSNDFSRISTGTRVIAINTPNTNNTGAWGTYRTSVDAIEAATGYNLLSNLPISIQTVIEANVDNGPTN